MLSQFTPGASYCCAGFYSGAGYCWGLNSSGQLGNSSTTQSTTAVAVTTSGVLSGKSLPQITGGAATACATDGGGAGYCWGLGSSGEAGDTDTSVNFNAPVPVAFRTALIAAGSAHSCVIRNGRAYCWGDNATGELGNNSTTQSLVPAPVSTSGVLSGVTLTQIATGPGFTCAVSAAGAAYCWGTNTSGQLGNNSTTQSLVPVAVNTAGALSGKTITQLTVGAPDPCALDPPPAADSGGAHTRGQHGHHSTTQSLVPVAVSTSGALSGKIVAQVTGGQNYGCGLDATGSGYCWGDNDDGELGNNSTSQSLVPVSVYTAGALSGVTLYQITTGTDHTCTLDTTGAAYCWGLNSSGQLGNDSTGNSSLPVTVQTLLPGPPTNVIAQPGNTTAIISWTAPASFGTGTLTGYAATAAPGGFTCSTSGATTCTITGLTNGVTYTITVVTHTTDGDSPPSTPVTVTPGGALSITAPASAALSAVADGATTTAQLGTVTVTDTRSLISASWTATVISTVFITGGGTSPETIQLTRVSYWSGPATATTGSGTFLPGQPTAGSAVTLTSAQTAFSLAGGSGSNSASWDPTLSIAVPATQVAGAYSGTITHSVS